VSTVITPPLARLADPARPPSRGELRRVGVDEVGVDETVDGPVENARFQGITPLMLWVCCGQLKNLEIMAGKPLCRRGRGR
jgi:hypothetical protein